MPRHLTALLQTLPALLLGVCLGSTGIAQDRLPGASDLPGNNASLSTSIRSLLPADEAFALSAVVESKGTIALIWDIEEGYYLYRRSLEVRQVDGDSIRAPEIPDGEHTSDEFFGEVEVYRGQLIVRIPYAEEELPEDRSIELELAYQGCAEAGYCYPMQRKAVSLEIL